MRFNTVVFASLLALVQMAVALPRMDNRMMNRMVARQAPAGKSRKHFIIYFNLFTYYRMIF